MRRSKSNPAKYARNYRKISQRKMTEFDHLDEEQEIKRLKNILKHSNEHLKNVRDSDDDSVNNDEKKHPKKTAKKSDAERAGDFSSLAHNGSVHETQEQQSASDQTKPPKSTKAEASDEDAAFERARELLRNSNPHLQQKSMSMNHDNGFDDSTGTNVHPQQSFEKEKGKKRNRQEVEDLSGTDNNDSRSNSNLQQESAIDGSSKTKKDQTKDASSTGAEVLLSEELLAEQQGHRVDTDTTELVILPSSKKKKKSNKKPKVELTPEEIKQAKQLRKKTERKLKQLSLRAEQKKKRAELYEKLQKTAISEEEMQLMSSSSTLGKRVSKKELLKKLIQKERAGIALTQVEKQLLYRDRGVDAVFSDDGSAREDEAPERKDPSSIKSLDEKSDRNGTNDEEGSALKTKKQSKAKKRKSEDSFDHNCSSDRVVEQETPVSSKTEKREAEPADASSFAAQMMASLSKLKVVSELQKEELDKEEAEEAERKRLEEESRLKATKGAPYKVQNPIKIQTAATNKNLPVQDLPAGNRRALTIARPEAVQKSRYDLPVTQMEYEVMDAVRNNDVTIICGETGSGKSTQIPQLLYESGFSLGSSPGTSNGSQDNTSTHETEHKFIIGVTQPRRVAAVSTAKRVCYEMGHGDGQTIKSSSSKRQGGNPVAYQTRYETAGLGDKTRVKFMTDGILLQEIQSDLLLRKYSVIVLDECHERNLNCDILCGLIGLALPLRKKASEEPGSGIVPLKLVIMSATLRVDDFVSNDKLFPSTKPFVVKIPGRTFPVTIHHSRETELVDYEDAAFRKICKIHRKLPQGGILVFLTGKQEIVRMVKKLKKALSPQRQKRTMQVSDDSCHVAVNDVTAKCTDIAYSDDTSPRDLDDDEIDGDFFHVDEDDFDDNLESDSEVVTPVKMESDDQFDNNMPNDVVVLPLYSLMSTEDQAKVFAAIPDGKRLIVCATNIAETSITIPNISYVVDTGRQKIKSYDAKTGVASFDVSWISKAAANQRAGRAGRTGPGHCYRLFSSSMFARHMDDFALPEVLTRPLEDVVLAMKAMKISSVAKFPFPTPPTQSQIDAAVKLLANLGCVELSEDDLESDGQVTRLGAAVSTFPLGVRCGKMLLVAAHAGVLDYAIAIVAAFSEKNPFIRGGEQDADRRSEDLEGHLSDKQDGEGVPQEKTKCKHWVHKAGDIYAVMLAIGAYTYAGRGAGGVSEQLACKHFCAENGLDPVIMDRIQKIRMHLSRLVKTRMAGAEGVAAKTGRIPHNMKPPNKVQEQLLMQVIVSGLLDNVAILAPLGTIPGNHPFSLRSAYLSCSSSMKEPLFMDRNSVLYSRDSRLLPQWVCYDYIVRKTLKDGTPLATMKNVTPINTTWLGTLAKGSNLLSLGRPLSTPRPAYDSNRDEIVCAVETKYGSHGWEISPVKMRMRDALKKPDARHSLDFRPDDNFRYFARFLLEGKIIPKLNELGPLLNDSPSIITGNKPLTKVGLIVSALSNADVDNASSLIRHWAEVDNKFLFKNLKGWVRPECASTAKNIWINAVKETAETNKI